MVEWVDFLLPVSMAALQNSQERTRLYNQTRQQEDYYNKVSDAYKSYMDTLDTRYSKNIKDRVEVQNRLMDEQAGKASKNYVNAAARAGISGDIVSQYLAEIQKAKDQGLTDYQVQLQGKLADALAGVQGQEMNALLPIESQIGQGKSALNKPTFNPTTGLLGALGAVNYQGGLDQNWGQIGAQLLGGGVVGTEGPGQMLLAQDLLSKAFEPLSKEEYTVEDGKVYSNKGSKKKYVGPEEKKEGTEVFDPKQGKYVLTPKKSDTTLTQYDKAMLKNQAMQAAIGAGAKPGSDKFNDLVNYFYLEYLKAATGK